MATQAYKLDDFLNDDVESKKTIKRELIETDSSQEGSCELPQVKNDSAAKKIKIVDEKKINDYDEDKVEKKPSPKYESTHDANDLTDIILCTICHDIIHNCIW